MNVLFSGIGGPTPIGLAKSLKLAYPESRCIGVDGSKWSASLYHSDVFDKTYVIESGDSPNYWESIEKVIEKESIDFAFIVPETEVLVWSKRQTERGDLPCKALVPNYNLGKFCFDKIKVAKALLPLGLTPTTKEYSQNESLLNFPFWIRVKSGAGALGALKIENEKDLETWMTLHNNRKDFMISEFLPGRNYACKLLYIKGELIQSASAERIDYLLSAAAPSGISGMCSRGRLLNRKDLVESSILALKTISDNLEVPLHGMFTVDFKEDVNGKPLITEINIRHVSFNHAFSLGGINFVKSTVDAIVLGLEHSEVCNEFQNESYFIRGVDAPLRLVD